MNKENSDLNENFKDYHWLGIASLLFTIAWSWIDDEENSLAWMKDIGSWISVLIYGLLVFVILYTSLHFLLSRYKGKAKILLSIAIGYVIAIALIFAFYSK